MAKTVDDFLDDEQVQEMLTVILRHIDNVIGGSQPMLSGDLTVGAKPISSL